MTRRARVIAMGVRAGLPILLGWALVSPAAVAGPPVAAENAADGFYSLRGGADRLLGPRQELDIRAAELISLDNLNTEFRLRVTLAYDEALHASWLVLVVAGFSYDQTGSGSGQELSTLGFSVSGAEDAERVARFLQAPIHYRRHPGHRLEVSFSPVGNEFSRGEEILAVFAITNVGDDAVVFRVGGRSRGSARDNQYLFCARLHGKQVEDIGSSTHLGGISTLRTLEPGETFEDRVDLGSWFRFAEPGTYEIHGAFFLDLHDRGTRSRTVWEDYASADFTVTVE